MIALDSATLITANKVQSDCDDIRITDINGKLIPHWVEPLTCNTSTTKIWTKVPSITTSGDTVYLYYGNSAVDSKSSTVDTFIREISGVQGAWDMDGTVGAIFTWATLADSSGNANTGTAMNFNATGMAYANSQFGQGVDFDGVDDFVAHDSISFDDASPYTYSVWLKWSGAEKSNVLPFGDTQDYASTIFLVSDGAKVFRYLTSVEIRDITGVDTTELFDGMWHYLVWTVESNRTVTVYIDGEFNEDATIPETDMTYNGIARGFSMSGFTFDGFIDNVRIYNQALSATEVSDLYGTGGDRQGYVTTNYPNKSLVRKYSASVSVGAPASEERGPGPVAYWKFDEGFGQTANDSTINANNGTLGGGTEAYKPTWQAEDMCVSGKCLKFDGVDDYVDGGNGESLQITGSFTVETWFNPKIWNDGTTGEKTIVNKNDYDSGNQKGWLFGRSWSSHDGIKFSVKHGDGTIDGLENVGNIEAMKGTWIHAVGVFSAGNYLKVYINGSEIESDNSVQASFVDADTKNVMIGKRSDGSAYFNGFIDSVKIYPYARTAAQIKADYASRGTASGVSVAIGDDGKKSLFDGLVGYWKMDEASWNGTADEVVDSSGSGNDGVAVGATGIPTTGAGKFGNGGIFDGVDDHVDFGNILTPDKINNRTYSVWVNPAEQSSETMFSLGNLWNWAPGHAKFVILSSTELLVSYDFDDGPFYTTLSCSTNLNQWNHLVFAIDVSNPVTTNIKAYNNGVYCDEKTINRATGSYNTSFIIGAETRGDGNPKVNHFNGSIDSVRIYNRALSPGEVRDLYNFAPGPVGWWKMDEKVSGTAQTINDSSGYGNMGTTSSANGTGMDCMVQGRYGSACEFDGVDDYVDAGSDASLNIGINDITISGWLKFNEIDGTHSFIKNGATNSSDSPGIWIRFMSTTTLNINFGQNIGPRITQTVTIPEINLNEFYHFTFVFDRDDVITTYLSGVAAAETVDISSFVSEDITNADSTKIGYVNSTYNHNGSIDDVRIYNYARTPSQIMEDYSAGAGRKQPIGHWKFDEGYGTTANNSGIGGSALNGTLTNMASPATSTSGWTDSGKMGKGLVFDGGNDYVILPGNNNTSSLKNDINTVSMWTYVRQYNAGGNDYGEIYSVLGGNRTGIKWQTNRIGIDANADFYNYYIPVNLSFNSWNHIVVEIDRTINKAKVYIDGVYKGQTNEWPSYTPTGDTVQIGKNSLTGNINDYLSGSIDDVKIYNYALTEDEVRKEYNQGALLKLGSTGTDGSGNADDSASREYCIPGDTSTCNPPVGRWDFNEGAGSTVNDITGNNNTGTWNGTGSHWTTGKIGKGGSFNGSDDYVNAGKIIMTSTSTICAWIKLNTSSQDRAIVGQLDNTFWTNYGEGIKYTNGNIIVMSEVNNDKTALSTALTDTVSWHHICGIVGTVDGKLYLDGIEKASGDLNSMYGSYWFEIGASRRAEAYSPTRFFNGQIDQVRIYDYARTPAQVAWDYNRGKPIAHWKFDECQGPTANDASGNGNDGTITIGATGTQDGIGTCTDGDTSNAWYNGRIGKYNSSMSFDGSDDSINVGNIASVNSATELTMSAWIKLNSAGLTTDGDILTKDFHSTDVPLLFWRDEIVGLGAQAGNVKALSIFIYDGTDTTWISSPNNSMDDMEWHYVVATFKALSPTGLKLYIDGILVQTGDTSLVDYIQTTANSIIIGNDAYDNATFNGLIDEAKVYNYALTAEQVKNEYNNGAVRFE